LLIQKRYPNPFSGCVRVDFLRALNPSKSTMKCLAILTLLSQAALGWIPIPAAFLHQKTCAFNSKATVDAASCSFQEALKIGAVVCQLLQAGDSEKATDETLGALLSHGNGIRYNNNSSMFSPIAGTCSNVFFRMRFPRGFFVHWLSDPTVTAAEAAALPPTLLAALGDSLSAESVQVVVMNAIMPTAMVVTYTGMQDAEAAASSAMTARRGTAVLKAAFARNERLRHQVSTALQAVDSHGSDPSVEAPNQEEEAQFWTLFFKKWGYEAAHVAAIKEMLRGVSSA